MQSAPNPPARERSYACKDKFLSLAVTSFFTTRHPRHRIGDRRLVSFFPLPPTKSHAVSATVHLFRHSSHRLGLPASKQRHFFAQQLTRCLRFCSPPDLFSPEQITSKWVTQQSSAQSGVWSRSAVSSSCRAAPLPAVWPPLSRSSTTSGCVYGCLGERTTTGEQRIEGMGHVRAREGEQRGGQRGRTGTRKQARQWHVRSGQRC